MLGDKGRKDKEKERTHEVSMVYGHLGVNVIVVTFPSEV